MAKRKTSPKTSSFVSSYTDAQYMVEMVYQNQVGHFAVLDGSGIKVEPKVIISGQTMKPHEDSMGILKTNVVRLPSEPKPYKSKRELLEQIQSYIHGFCDMPAFWEKLSAHYALMTWVFDRFGSVPYLRFLGEFETGKTRMWEAVGNCSYRPIFITGGTTVAPMFRIIEKYKGTLLIDEADFKDSELDSAIIKVLNVGYRAGGNVLRAEKVADTYTEKAFDVFSPKILTSRKRFADEATESRCLTYVVPNNKRIRAGIPIQILPHIADSFREQGQEIRNMCLQWRFDVWRTLQPDLNVPVDLPSRSREIAVPILSVINDPAFRDEFLDWMCHQGRERRQESQTALCVQAVNSVLGTQTKGRLIVGDVQREMIRISEESGDELSISSKAVGDMMRQLRFDPAPRTGKGRQYWVTRKQMDELLDEFHLR